MNMDSGFTSSHESMDKTQKQSSEWAANQKHNQRVENTRVLMGPAVPAMPPVPSNFPPVPTGTIITCFSHSTFERLHVICEKILISRHHMS